VRLRNKACLVTGGGAGIGAAAVRLFRQEGAEVFVVDSQPGKDVGFVADVSDPDKAKQAVEKLKRLDVLVCNAAMRNYSALADATPEEWHQVVAVNLLGAANYVRAALPLLRKSGKGSIVLVSSVYGVAGRSGMGLYDATKAALLAMARTLAHEEATHGIRANAVCPGSTLTDFHVNKAKAAGRDIEELKRARDDTSLIGRWASPEEIAWPILWLASDEASFITGATLMVDGGLSVK
jgi:2-hydroxycyclohexanecarboxyl-CoA dehydrogenase